MKRFGPVWARKGDGEKVLAPSGLRKEMVKRFGPFWARKGDCEKVWPCLERPSGGSWEPLGEPLEACGTPWELVGGPGYRTSRGSWRRFGPFGARRGDGEKVWAVLDPERRW